MKGGLMPTSQIMEWPAVNPNEDFTYEVAMNDFLDDKEDLGNYPVQFQYLKFFLDASSQTAGQKYKIRIKNFRFGIRQSHFERPKHLHWHPRYEFFLIRLKPVRQTYICKSKNRPKYRYKCTT